MPRTATRDPVASLPRHPRSLLSGGGIVELRKLLSLRLASCFHAGMTARCAVRFARMPPHTRHAEWRQNHRKNINHTTRHNALDITNQRGYLDNMSRVSGPGIPLFV